MADLKRIIEKAKIHGYSKKEIIDLLTKKGYEKEEIQRAFGDKNNAVTTNEKDKISQIDKIRLLLSSPKEFFREIRDETISNSLATVVVIGLFVNVINYFFMYIIGGFGIFSYYGLSRLGLYLGFFSYVLIIIGSFIYAAIAQFIAKLFSGRGTFTDTYNALAYSSIPVLILSIIPFIGIFAWIYGLVLSVFGISEYHELSKGKAIGAVLIPILIFVIILFFIFLVSVYKLRRIF